VALRPRGRRRPRHGIVLAATWSGSPVSLMARGLARTLTERGHPVTFLAARHPGMPPGTEGIPEVLPWPGAFRTLASWRFAWGVLGRRPEAIIANFSAVSMLMVLGFVRRVPVRIAWYNTLAAAIDLDTGPLPWWRRYPRFRKRFVYKLATTVVAASDVGARDLVELFGVPPSKVVVQRNLVPDLAEGRPAAGPDRAGPPRFVCVARLYPVKDHATLFRAVARTTRPLHVDLLGEGPLQGELEALAAELGITDRITFRGLVTQEAVLDEVETAWATVLASKVENFGLAPVESMLLGVPVVATATCELPATVGEGPDAGGRLFPVGDDAALAAHLDELAADPALRDRLAAAARARFVERFEMERHLPEAADRLLALVDAGPGHPSGPPAQN
jgi:glycosyltransferase involved in cell wall biosynthesis